jgi:hypothetical protein
LTATSLCRNDNFLHLAISRWDSPPTNPPPPTIDCALLGGRPQAITSQQVPWYVPRFLKNTKKGHPGGYHCGWLTWPILYDKGHVLGVVIFFTLEPRFAGYPNTRTGR